MSNNYLWVEKYRPSTVDDYIFHSDSQKKTIKTLLENGDIPHLMFHGIQGTGKTTLSKIIVNALPIDMDIDVKKINASDENNVDTIRSKIKSFAQGYPVGKFKVIRLEECDYLTPAAQAILRDILEEYAGNCRFIATCNNINRIIKPLQSRFQTYEYKAPSKNDILVYAGTILTKEDVKFELDTLQKFVDIYYPDIRKIVNELQACSITGELKVDEESGADYKFDFIEQIERSDFRAIRKYLKDTGIDQGEYENLYEFFYQNIEKSKTFNDDINKYEAALTSIGNYLYRHAMVAFPYVNFDCMLIQLQKIADQ